MADPTNVTISPAPAGLTGIVTAPDAGAAEKHQPYVPDARIIPEFTWQAVVVGAALGILFGASSLYLVLRVGMTVSASIPVAVLAITLFRGLSRVFGLRGATILENNITQTAGSAGESIAFGVGVTMPALMLLGFDMDLTRVMVVSVLGGLLGILMMIPLRRAFIVQMHGKPGQPDTLLYPEGTACAEVLISGEKGGTSGATVFIGFGVAFVIKLMLEGMSLMRASVALPLKFFNRAATLATEMAPELVGVGYVIGIRIAAVMMAGAVIGNLVIVPAIATFGDYVNEPIAPATKTIKQMSLGDIQKNYLRYIGAGAVTAAGIISMFRTLPTIIRSFRASLGKIGIGGAGLQRTERDIPPKYVMLGTFLLLGLLTAFLARELFSVGASGFWWKAILGAILVVVFGFLFVTVSSRLTGEIGSSSNPISGMTVATLALTCLIFLMLGMTSPIESVVALSIGGVVCIAASNGGTTAQDLKTGFLVGGTPIYQQYAIFIGALTSALVIGGILLVFNYAGTVYTEKNLPSRVLSQEQFDGLKEKKTYKNKEYSVWQVPEKDASGVPAGTYFVANNRQIVAAQLPGEEEPTSEKLPPLVLSKDVLDGLTETKTYKDVTYRVWRPRAGNELAPPGKYYVDDAGQVVMLEDPAITGRVKTRDDGTEVKMKFEAPKTEVIGIIITGVLEQKLNWGLVLIGAMLAVGLELCGVSSLAFAVGVYIPMQYTTPIFLGGIVRWAVDKFNAPPTPAAGTQDEAKAIAETETGPGVLLSSGYIAGGTLAGVLIAFLELPFFEWFKKKVDFSVKVGESQEPAISGMWERIGLDFAPLPLLLGLMGFLLLVGLGVILSPRKK